MGIKQSVLLLEPVASLHHSPLCEMSNIISLRKSILLGEIKFCGCLTSLIPPPSITTNEKSLNLVQCVTSLDIQRH